MDKGENLEPEPYVSGGRKLNAAEEVERQQQPLDNEMVLYVNDRSTLMHCKYLRNVREITIVEITIGDDELNALRTCKSLISISLLHCDGFDNLCVLAKIPTLQVIYVYTRGPLRYIDSLNQLPALRKLTLSCNNIGERDILVLEEMTRLEHISIFYCGDVIYERGSDYIRSTIITDDNIRDFCKSRSLVKIDFERCRNLTDVTPLAAIQTLEWVNLSDCYFVQDIGALGRLTYLKELDLRDTAINDDSLCGLSESRSLVKINLEGCTRVTTVAPLEAIETLEFITLSGCLSLKDIGAVGRLTRLKELDLRDTAINDDSLCGLSESRSLVKINLEGCTRVTTVAPLEAIETLEFITLSGCLSLKDIGAVGRLTRLKELDLRDTAINDDSLCGLSESRSLVKINLEGCKNLTAVHSLVAIQTLESITLSSCLSLKDIGAVGRLTRLKELDLRDTAINDDCLCGLSESRSLVKINLEGCTKVTTVAPLEAIETLEFITLSGCLSLKDIGAVGRLTHLKELDLRDTAINDDSLCGLSESRSLVKINLEGCKKLADLVLLAEIQTLEVVNLSRSFNMRNLTVLGRLPRLRELNLSETAITDDDMRSLSESRSLVRIDILNCKRLRDVAPLAAIQTLEVVNMKGCRDVRNVGPLGKLPKLKEIWAGGTCIDYEDLRALRVSPSLVMINLDDCGHISDVNPLTAIKTLELLYLCGCHSVSAVGLLGRLPRLRQLHMRETPITDDGLRGLSESRSLVHIVIAECDSVRDVSLLLAIPTLKEVVLDSCRNMFGVGVFGGHPGLEKICVIRMPFSDDDLRGLSESRSLVKVNLENCKNLRDVAFLAAIQTLEAVNINDCNNVSDVGALGGAPKLKELFANNTSINDDGIRGLSASRSLVRIEFEGCKNLTDVTPLEDIQTLEEVRLTNSSNLREIGVLGRLRKLKILYANETAINDDGLRALGASRSLVRIELGGCHNLTHVTPLEDIQTLEYVYIDHSVNVKDISALGRLPKLKELNTTVIAISHDNLYGLSASRSLVKIVLVGCDNVTDVSHLAGIQTLEHLDLDYVHMTDVGALGKMPRLRVLLAKWSDINDDGLRGLGASRSLVRIVLERCLSLTDVSPLAAIQTLEWVNISYSANVTNFAVLGSLPYLRELYASETAINDDGLRGLGASRSLVKIDLEGCLSLTDVSPLAAIQTLEWVNLSYCDNVNQFGALRELPRWGGHYSLHVNAADDEYTDDDDDDYYSNA